MSQHHSSVSFTVSAACHSPDEVLWSVAGSRPGVRCASQQTCSAQTRVFSTVRDSQGPQAGSGRGQQCMHPSQVSPSCGCRPVAQAATELP